MLDSLKSFERDKLCDCLKIEKFEKGQTIIKQGETGHIFYFVKNGTLKATKDGEGEVFSYKENDYFGELSLLRDAPRAANIIATSDCVLASIDRASFKRLLGPLQEILKRNTARYETFVKK